MPKITNLLIGYNELAKEKIIILSGYNKVRVGGTEGEIVECRRIYKEPVKSHARKENGEDVVKYSTERHTRIENGDGARENTITMKEFILTYTVTGDIILNEEINLEPYSTKCVQVYINNLPPNFPKYSIVSSSESCMVKGLEMRDAIHESDQKHFTTVVTNYTGHPLHLVKGTRIGEGDVFPCVFTDNLTIEEEKPVLTCGHITVDETPKSDRKKEINEELGQLDFSDYRNSLIELLNDNGDAIMLRDDPIGHCNLLKHKIVLKDSNTKPVFVPSYRLSHYLRGKLKEELVKMEEQGIIRPSSSRWSSPLFLVPKRIPGQVRVVVDYRRLNTQIEDELFYMPSISEILGSLKSENKVYSTLDLGSGFFQLELEEDSKEYTAFNTPVGRYEFNRLPMGLKTSPAFFQRLMSLVLSGQLGQGVFVYIDDICILSPDVETHLKTLGEVLAKLKEAGLKVKLSKCKFLTREVEFLGHILSGKGIRPKENITKAIVDFPAPNDVKSLRSFLGLAGYYRAFINEFASIAHPLFKLLRKSVDFEWGSDQQMAFEKLKMVLTSAPCLAYPDYTKPFVIHTDASNKGFGASLMQRDDRDKLQPIGFASRSLKPAELNYSVTDLEGAALIWALQTFKDKILNYSIEVWTDHRALVNIFDSNDLSGRRARWKYILQSFNPDIIYMPGYKNQVADCLSRYPASPIIVMATNVFAMASDNMLHAQEKDDFCIAIKEAILNPGSVKNNINPDEFVIAENGMIYKKRIIENKGQLQREVYALVIPKNKVEYALGVIHGSKFGGHPGKERAQLIAQKQFFWQHMRKDIDTHINGCETCALVKPKVSGDNNLGSYPIPNGPFQVIAIDLMKMPTSHSGNNYLFVATCHFSRFAVLKPIRDKEAATIVDVLIKEVVCRLGKPEIIISDNGGEFVNHTFERMCQEFGIVHKTVNPYSPQSNGLVERLNRKILEEMRCICLDRDQDIWDELVPFVECSINALPNVSTGESPHFIVYGVDKPLPGMLSVPVKPVYTSDYFSHINNKFNIIHEQVRNKLTLSKENMLLKVNSPRKAQKIKENDVVFNKCQTRDSKIDKLFEGPFRVINIKQNSATLQNIETGKQSRAHTNNLKLVPRVLGEGRIPPEGQASVPHTGVKAPTVTPAHQYNLRSRVNACLIDEFADLRAFCHDNNITLVDSYQ